MNEGDLLEYRINRLMFYQGFLSRGRVSLKSVFYPERVDITDVDVFAIKFLDDLSPYTTICECKSGKDAGSVDRLIWLKGLSQYLMADAAYFVRKQFSPKIKEFAISLNITPLDYLRIDKLEKQLGIADRWLGSHDYAFFHEKMLENYRVVSSNSNLLRIYWFLKSKFWYSDNSTRLIRLMSALDQLIPHLEVSKGPEKDASRWLFIEILILLSVAVISLCSEIQPLDTTERRDYITAKMVSDKLSLKEMKDIMQSVRLLAQSIVKERTGESVWIDDKLVRISPPRYTDHLIEVSERILEHPLSSRKVPLFLDMFLYEFTLKDKGVNESLLEEFFQDPNMVSKMAKNIVKFASDESAVLKELLGGLLSL